MSEQDNPKPMPEGLKKFLEGLQELADKARDFTNKQRRTDGWIPPEEFNGTMAMLRLIHKKTSNVELGKEKELIESIHAVLSDYLNDK